MEKNSSIETTLVQEVNIMKSQDLLCLYFRAWGSMWRVL